MHVVGQVKRPQGSRRELPAGSRVAQAVAAAGGAKSGADLNRVNLARVLIDGEQVRIPSPGDPVDPREHTGPALHPVLVEAAARVGPVQVPAGRWR